jgi:hypothetical protein
MKSIFNGTDGQVGSIYFWDGNNKVGKGFQELIKISTDRIEYKLGFIEPWESISLTYFTLEPEEQGVKVSWHFESESPYPFNFLTLFMDMEEMVGKNFQRDLRNFKLII